MTVEIRPLGVKCNLACDYCYQTSIRKNNNPNQLSNIQKVKKEILKRGKDFTLFGGEPLMLPLKDLEDLFRFGYDHFGKNGIQTNGVLIRDSHINLFKKYNVHVGFSIDGPGESNDARKDVFSERTRESTNKSNSNIIKLLNLGISTSLIITLHKINAGNKKKQDQLFAWIKDLYNRGLMSINIHPLEIDTDIAERELRLSDKKTSSIFLKFADFVKREIPNLKMDIFRDIVSLLLGKNENVSCIWNSCDPFTTEAVQGIEGNGEISNCGRVNKGEIDWKKSNFPSYERYLSLFQTPQSENGCKDCKYWVICRGNCPGTAIDHDFRNRSMYCTTWKSLIEYFENELIFLGLEPITLNPKRKLIEEILFESWLENKNISLSTAIYQANHTWYVEAIK